MPKVRSEKKSRKHNEVQKQGLNYIYCLGIESVNLPVNIMGDNTVYTHIIYCTIIMIIYIY